MYGLAVGTDVSALVGCTLESLDLTPFQLQLRFDAMNNIVLSIESQFAVRAAGGPATTYERPPDAAQALANLFGLHVTGADVTAPGTLHLRWEDSTELWVMDSNEHYESFQLSLGQRFIVV